MLYITTRNKTDSYTAYRALHEGITPDGGYFLPIRFPAFTKEQIASLKDKSFCETVADILNVFFSTRLTGWDIEFAVGRKPISFANIGRKLMVVELWRNTENSYSVCSNRIYSLLCGEKTSIKKACGWASIAIRVAFVFAIYGSLLNSDVTSVDVAASGGDLESVVSLWYARKMGLPIGKIICGSNENCTVWDLFYKGQIDTAAAVVATDTPDMDQTIPACLECLIYSSLGPAENLRYLDAVAKNGIYQVRPTELSLLNNGMFCAVVGQGRGRDVIKSVHSTNQYLLDPYSAISYGALQDYRAKSGENRMTLLFTEEKPACYSSVISQATGLSAEQISKF